MFLDLRALRDSQAFQEFQGFQSSQGSNTFKTLTVARNLATKRIECPSLLPVMLRHRIAIRPLLCFLSSLSLAFLAVLFVSFGNSDSIVVPLAARESPLTRRMDDSRIFLDSPSPPLPAPPRRFVARISLPRPFFATKLPDRSNPFKIDAFLRAFCSLLIGSGGF